MWSHPISINTLVIKWRDQYIKDAFDYIYIWRFLQNKSPTFLKEVFYSLQCCFQQKKTSMALWSWSTDGVWLTSLNGSWLDQNYRGRDWRVGTVKTLKINITKSVFLLPGVVQIISIGFRVKWIDPCSCLTTVKDQAVNILRHKSCIRKILDSWQQRRS